MILTLTAVAWLAVFAQSAGAPDASSIISGLITSSPLAAVLAYAWISERADRRAKEEARSEERREWEEQRAEERAVWEDKLATANAAYLTLLERALPLFDKSTTALRDVLQAMSSEVQAASRRTQIPGIDEKIAELVELLKRME